MTNFIEENPWTFWLASTGILLGLIIPSALQTFITNYDFSQSATNPSETLTGFITGFAVSATHDAVIKVSTSLIVGMVGAIMGLFIDMKKYNLGGYIY